MFSRIVTVNSYLKKQHLCSRVTLEELEFFETMGSVFKETYSPHVPAELTYTVVIGYSSILELE